MIISWTVYGEPKPKRTGKICTVGGHARLVMNEGTRQAEQDFGLESLKHKPSKPFTGPLRMTVKFYRAKGRPASKKGQEAAERGEILPTKKPDNSNLLKMIEDALNGIFYLDDAQIVSHEIGKYFSDTPRTEITIETLEEVG